MAHTQSPPSFEEARNRRQKVRAAGLNPNHWYAVEHSHALKRGQAQSVRFWKKSYAIYRGADGAVYCVEDRCAHRQLKLSVGHVEGCSLRCIYHGWKFDGDGRVVEIPHETFGKKVEFQIASYAVRERYGLIWVFFGPRERAADVPMPEIPELEGPEPWACVPVDLTWNAHHSMIIDNVSDFTHAYLHRRFKPFDQNSKLTRCEAVGDKVYVSYDTFVGGGRISGLFVDRQSVNTRKMDLCYDYPYQWSNTDNQIKHWLSVLPIDERTTRAFFLFYFKQLKVPLLPVHIPQRLMRPLLKVANEVLVKPLLREDGFAVEEEQRGYEENFDAPIAELNPAVLKFQTLTIRRWEEHLAEEGGLKQLPKKRASRKGGGKDHAEAAPALD